MGKITSMHFYAWEKGLKTGMYYLRTKAATQAIQFTVQKQAKPQLEPVVSAKEEYTSEEAIACSIDNPDDCIACGS